MPANGETVLQELRCSLRELGRISLFERPDRDAPELAAEMAPGRLRYGPEARAAAAQAGEPLEKVDRIEDSETDCRLQINPIGIG
jgi:hypothetical protein